MSSVNSIQHGGDHYKTGENNFQHWDIIDRYNVPYIEGCATKYVLRWRRKNGVEDLKKALHFIQKRLETLKSGKRVRMFACVPKTELDVLFALMGSNDVEKFICRSLLLTLYDEELIKDAAHVLEQLIAENSPGTPDDGGHHA